MWATDDSFSIENAGEENTEPVDKGRVAGISKERRDAMRWTGKKGFTLVEVLLVVVILGLLAMVAIPRFVHSGTDAKTNACKANVALLNSQIELYAATNDGTYPADQAEFGTLILNNTDLFPDGPPACPYGDPYVYNATTKRVTAHSH